MKKFDISTDSTCDLYQNEIKELGVFVGHLTYTIQENGELFEEKDNYQDSNQYVEFYQRLKNGALAKTSILNVQTHVEVFSEMAEKGIKNALHICQGKGLSPTVDNANAAIEIVKGKYPDINYVAVESNTTTCAEGILVRIACEMRDNGKTLEETVALIEDMKHKLQHFIVVDDLMYLKRGGRISGPAAIVGSVLQLRPIIQFTKDGKLKVVRKENGQRKAFKSIIKEIKDNYTFTKQHFKAIIVHTNNEEGANILKAEIEKELNISPEIRIMGPIIGAHVGPGAVAFTFTSNELRKFD